MLDGTFQVVRTGRIAELEVAEFGLLVAGCTSRWQMADGKSCATLVGERVVWGEGDIAKDTMLSKRVCSGLCGVNDGVRTHGRPVDGIRIPFSRHSSLRFAERGFLFFLFLFFFSPAAATVLSSPGDIAGVG